MNNTTALLRDLIKQDNTKVVLEHLSNITKNNDIELYNSCILLQSTLYQLQQSRVNYTITDEEFISESNEIKLNTLQLINEVENKGWANDYHIEMLKSDNQNTHTWKNINKWILTGVLCLFGAFAFVTFFKNNVLNSVSKSTHQTEENQIFNAEKVIKLPKQRNIIFEARDHRLAYQITKITLSTLDDNKNCLKIYLRAAYEINGNLGPINFWDDSFYLESLNGMRYSPDGGLNELVVPNSYKDGILKINIPKNEISANFVAKHINETHKLYLEW